MRKTISILITVMFITLLSSFVSADIFFNDSFDRPDSATVGNGWVEQTETGGSTLSISDNKLRMIDASTSGKYIIYHSNMNIDPTFYNITFQLNASQNSLQQEFVAWDTGRSNLGIHIRWKNNGDLCYLNNVPAEVCIDTYTENVWVEHTLVVNESSFTYDWYEAGVLIGNDLVFRQNVALDEVYFESSTTDTGTFRVDNFSVYNASDVVPSNFTVNDSVESTAIVKQVGTVTLTNPSFATIFSSDFNVTVNNTDLYGAYSFNVESGNSNSLECQLLIDGGVVGTVTRTQTPGEVGSIFLMSDFFSLETGTHSQELQCRRSAGGGTIDVYNAVGIGHFMIDEDLNVIPHTERLFENTTSSSDYELLDEFDFTISNKSIGGEDNITAHLVMEWSATYTNNAGASELLNTYIELNGSSNCSFYPRTVSSGGTGSVSGDCAVRNAEVNGTYTVKFYGKGTNAVFNVSLKAKEFRLSPEEIAGGTGFPVPFNFSGDTNTLLFAINDSGNLNHDNTNVFEKNAFSLTSNETTQATFFVELVNSVNFTTINFTRTINTDVGVLIGHDVLQNVGQDTYVSKLWANCGSPTAECSIVGGDGIGYITDVTTTVTNSFNLEVLDNFDDSAVLNFSAVDGATFTTTTGNLTYFTTADLVNFTVTSNWYGGYFNKTFINHNTSEDLTVRLNQTEVRWDCKEVVSGADLSCFIPSESTIFNYNVLGNPHTQNVQVVNYFATNNIFNVTAFQNNTLNSTHGNVAVSFNSSSDVGTVSDCIYNLSSNDYTWTTSLTGNPNSSLINLINGIYEVTADCVGFAITIENVTVSESALSLFQYNFTLFTTNSINFTFRDSDTNELLDNITITTQFIGADDFTTNTTNGTLYVDLLSPSSYSLQSDAEGYRQTQYILTVTNRSTQSVTIFMQKENNSELVLISVKDRFAGTPITNAQVTIQRWVNDSWITDQILETDFQGRTEGHFVLSTVYYNFVVEFGGVVFFGTINSDPNKKLIFAEDVSNGINIEIDITPNTIIRDYQSLYEVAFNLTFTNTSNTSGYYRFFFSDENNLDRVGTVNVYANGELNTSCTTTSATATIICPVSVGVNQSEVFTAIALIDGQPVDALVNRLGVDERYVNWGALGYFLALLVFGVTTYAFLKIPAMSLLAGSGALALLIFFEVVFNGIGIGYWMLFLAAAFIIARIPTDKGSGGGGAV